MIFVMGASGRMGGAVVRHAGTACRAGTRDGRRVDGATETVMFDLETPVRHADALKGCDGLFVMRPPAITARAPFDRLMAAARDAGVAHVVCASVHGAGTSRVLPHRHMEAAVRKSGLPCTFLRPADFMQNLADVHGQAIRARGEIAVPAGRGRSAFLDAEDVGRAAARTFADPAAHDGWAYDLMGPDALGFEDVAHILTQVLGRKVRYRTSSLPRFVLDQVRAGRPLSMALVMGALYTAQRLGRAAPVSPDFERLAGRAPTALASYVGRERDRFAPGT